ncbi:permease [Candidatus Solincola sp.]|nr:permease [Actinomycetota bacterium]MDI7251942.1 permease [Actinomycetota bacterium]
MSVTAMVIDSLVAICLVVSLLKDRGKTRTALRIAWNAVKRMGPSVLAVIAVIGLIVGFIPARWIASTIGGERGALGLLIAAALGSVLFIPALIAFPLARSLLDMGAGVMSMAAFITTLTMIGFVFLPLEIRELDRRFALLRNGLSLLVALAIAVLMGLIL